MSVQPRRAGASLLPTLVLLMWVTALVTSLGAPLVPDIAEQHGVSLAAAQWSLTVCLLTGAMATPIIGRVGSGHRRRPVLVGGMLLVTLGCALAALPLPFPCLLFGRALQGLGLGLAPLAMAVARDALPRAEVPAKVATLSAIGVAGVGLGFPVTAVTADLAGVGGAFWFGTAMSLLTLVMAARFVPPAARTALPPVDIPGALLLTVGIGSILLVVSQVEQWGWRSAPSLSLAALGAVALAAWVPWTLRVPHPLVDLRLAAHPMTRGAHLTSLLAGTGMYMGLMLVMIVVQAEPRGDFGLGQPVAVAGLLLVPYSAMSVIGSRLALRVARRVRPERLLPWGCRVYALANLLLAFLHDEVWQVLMVMAAAGTGSGFTFAIIPMILVRAVPPEETGSTLSVAQVLRYIGFSIGSTLAVSVLALASPGSDPTHAGMVTAGLVTALACGAATVIAWRATRTGREPRDAGLRPERHP